MNIRRLILAALLPLLFASSACSQESPSGVHPEIQPYLNWSDWPLVSPGDVEATEFQPFSASYVRYYRNGSGEDRQDWVLLSAEESAWYGEAALIVSFHDAGSLEFDDTSMRTQTVYLRKSDLSVLFAVAPKSGTPHDLDVVRVLDDRIVRTVVKSESGESESFVFQTEDPVFWGQRYGFGSLNYLIWGAMDLEKVSDFRFDRVYYPGADQAGPAFVRNMGMTEVEDASGKTHQAYLLETTLNPSSTNVSQWYVVNEAPYLIATGRRDVTTDKISWSRKLERLTLLD